jgi:hypothetical protein
MADVSFFSTLGSKVLLNPADPSLDFVRKREDARPMAVYWIDNRCMVCYAGSFPLDRFSR